MHGRWHCIHSIVCLPFNNYFSTFKMLNTIHPQKFKKLDTSRGFYTRPYGICFCVNSEVKTVPCQCLCSVVCHMKSLMQGRFPYFIHEFEPCRTIRTASCRHGVFSYCPPNEPLSPRLSMFWILSPWETTKPVHFRVDCFAEELICSPSMRDQRPGQKNSPRTLTSGVGHARSIETSMRRLTSNDRNGAISYWIFTNKISSFRKLQDLSNSIFAFKIGLKMTSNEVRKTT